MSVVAEASTSFEVVAGRDQEMGYVGFNKIGNTTRNCRMQWKRTYFV